uniref:Secreted protein n=1 Tax=Rhipicephalus zambeziensis TaxID=60191 RepID=A0A224Y5I0_9ACAR
MLLRVHAALCVLIQISIQLFKVDYYMCGIRHCGRVMRWQVLGQNGPSVDILAGHLGRVWRHFFFNSDQVTVQEEKWCKRV